MLYAADMIRSGIDLRPLGLEFRDAESNYFCSPIGTEALFWTGVDGIHYGTIRDFGETVFVICPMNTPGHYVYPVAENWTDFLRLLLACGDEAAVSQASMWTQAQFDAFLAAYPPTEEQRKALETLRSTFHLTAMDAPYEYIHTLQQTFDYRRLRFSEEYEEWAPAEPKVPTAPAWTAGYGFGFFEQPEAPCGTVLPGIRAEFEWAGVHWHIPAIYACEEGLVADLCGEFSAEDTDALMLAADETVEGLAELDALHPARMDFRLQGLMNGRPIQAESSSGRQWIPVVNSAAADLESRWVLEHYGFSTERAWRMERYSFPWPDGAGLPLHSLELTCVPYPMAVPGATFRAPAVGKKVRLTHPKTGAQYILTVEELAQETLSHTFPEDGMEHPTRYTRMAYRLSPDLPDRAFRIGDTFPGDPSRPKKRSQGRMQYPEAHGSVAVAMIGGADGPTTLALGGAPGQQGRLHMAASALRFEPAPRITWQITFMEMPCEPITVTLTAE